eukprot:TRINITY_DN1815_c0_g2_i3.p1 TRINITY_DN1815_c0_g2~~TRINITY_DN1815_c0_g2_i3.p1  ORF type:complete len:443 (+),score=112.91 TRINITY_DN1815_c0_g2_i3:126-1331(+)
MVASKRNEEGDADIAQAHLNKTSIKCNSWCVSCDGAAKKKIFVYRGQSWSRFGKMNPGLVYFYFNFLAAASQYGITLAGSAYNLYQNRYPCNDVEFRFATQQNGFKSRVKLPLDTLAFFKQFSEEGKKQSKETTAQQLAPCFQIMSSRGMRSTNEKMDEEVVKCFKDAMLCGPNSDPTKQVFRVLPEYACIGEALHDDADAATSFSEVSAGEKLGVDKKKEAPSGTAEAEVISRVDTEEPASDDINEFANPDEKNVAELTAGKEEEKQAAEAMLQIDSNKDGQDYSNGEEWGFGKKKKKQPSVPAEAVPAEASVSSSADAEEPTSEDINEFANADEEEAADDAAEKKEEEEAKEAAEAMLQIDSNKDGQDKRSRASKSSGELECRRGGTHERGHQRVCERG